MTLGQSLVESFLRPVQIMILDPAITYTAVYTSLVYGTYYSFFEALPLVYPVFYGFTSGEIGLVFLSVLIGVLISLAIYCLYIWAIWQPAIRTQGLGAPENCLIPGLYACFIPPVGLFIIGKCLPAVAWLNRWVLPPAYASKSQLTV
jgi:DHA1 family multidrug resistance protein-like MFS transporter